MQKSFLYAAFAVAGARADSNPLSSTIALLSDLEAKVKADAEAEAKAYKQYFEWCDDVSRNAKQEIETSTAQKAKLEASIAKASSDASVSTSKVNDLAGSIAGDEGNMKAATAVRGKEAADFAAAEGELVATIDTLDRAVSILSREMKLNPAALAQVDTSSMSKVVSALSTVVDGAGFTASDKGKLMALMQSNSDEDDADAGAPAAAVYKTHSTNILDILVDIKEKAESTLSDLRKNEGANKHNFAMLKQSLEAQLAADSKDLAEEKAAKAAALGQKATDEADLQVASKDLANSKTSLEKATSGCLTTAADHEATVAARNDELKVIAQAKSILSESTAGAVGQTYSFIQTGMSLSDLKRNEVAAIVKSLAKQHHSAALSQLASRIGVVFQYGGASRDVFGKVKDLIGEMITRLEKEAESDANEKAYCDEETANSKAKKEELDGTISKLTTKIDQAAAKSEGLKEDVSQLQAELATLFKQQSQMDSIRAEESKNYVQAKADLEQGLAGVQKALELLRTYYGEASFVQQPAVPIHAKSVGAGQSIIGVLEVVESDFSKNLAKEEAAESDSAAQYEVTTQENKIIKANKDQDALYMTAEFKELDKHITELTGDRGTASAERQAVLDYYAKIKDRCIAKPETYEDRTARRTAEITGLKQALSILENETAFVQRKSRSFRGHLAA